MPLQLDEPVPELIEDVKGHPLLMHERGMVVGVLEVVQPAIVDKG